MYRVFQQAAFAVQQAEIDAPGIDADRVEASSVARFGDPLLDLREKPK